MKPGIIYRIDFQNFDGDLVRIDIQDTATLIGDFDTANVIGLRGTGNPLSIKVIDNEDDKFTCIRAKQANIEFLSNASYNIGTFADGPDNRFRVEILLNPTSLLPSFLFIGFLVTDDLQQLFLPYPQTVVLTASDHLGLLKGIPLTDDAGKYMKDHYKISYFIAQCLNKTELNLPINVIHNLRVGGGSITGNTSFVAGGPYIATAQTTFFYPGQRIRVIGSSFNDGDYTVGGTTLLIAQFAYIIDGGPLVNESGSPDVIIQDISSTTHIYDTVYIEGLTFESSVNAAQDCYSVLQAILKEGQVLTQFNGAWWIVSVDEYEANPTYVATFDYLGIYQGIVENNITRTVGSLFFSRWANANTNLELERAKAFISETFRYSFPTELICNMTFERGDLITQLPDETIENVTYQVKSFETECWEYNQWQRNDNAPITANGTNYIKKLYYNGAERDRFMHMNEGTVNGQLRSEPLAVSTGDKIVVGISSRWPAGRIPGTTPATLAVELKGDNGKFYYLYGTGSTVQLSGGWFEYPAGSGGILDISYTTSPSSQDYESWQSQSYESQPLPVSGRLFFYLVFDDGADGPGGVTYVEHSDFSVQYLPFINGSYREISGQSYTVKRNELGYLASREQEVFISNAPRINMKGALQILTGGKYWLAPYYYPAWRFALNTAPDQTSAGEYGKLQAFAVWNQNRNTIRKFTGDVIGFGVNWPDVIHKFVLSDTNPNTNDRFFLLISMDQNWKSCQMQATFVECYRSDGKGYTDPLSFKYLTS